MPDSSSAASLAEAVLASSPLAIISVERDGCVLSWNPAAERVFGWTAEETIGLPLLIVPDRRVAEAAGWWSRAFDGEILTGLETIRRRRDGKELDVGLSIAPLRPDSGPVTSILFMYVDISQRRGAEEALRRTADELRAIVDCSPVPIGAL